MKKFHLFLLSVLSGVILALAWPERGFPGLLFIGFVPLLFIEDYISLNQERFIKFSLLFYSLPAFLIWNGLTTWWIVNSTGYGALLAIFLNSLFMAIIFNLFHYSKGKFGSGWQGYIALICFWIGFEYLHLNWDLNWPWLNIGNGFASYYKWIQWYEYTGIFGGTLWVLVSNIMAYSIIDKGFRLQASGFRPQASGIRHPASGIRHLASGIWHPFTGFWLLWIIIPIIISYLIYSNYREESHPVNIVIVQPNLDPYSEQYTVPPSVVIGRIMQLALPLLDSSTNFLAAPESAIQEDMWENDINTFSSIRLLKEVNHTYPSLNILVGGSTYYAFQKGEKVPSTARKFKDTNAYYNRYNTAIVLNSTGILQLYHKSRLTPGVEIMPTFWGWNFMEKYAIDLGGIVGSLGTDKERKVFRSVKTVKTGCTICYESVFGEFFSEFVMNGADIMFIITNDGWWGNTGGYRQHFAFAHLRAIETRRCIARSANTGISAFIDQRGDAHQQTKYWEPAAIKGTLNANSSLTFYTRHGDYIARIATGCGIIFLIGTIVIHILQRRKSKL